MTDCHHSFPDPHPQPISQIGNCRSCGIAYQEAWRQHQTDGPEVERAEAEADPDDLQAQYAAAIRDTPARYPDDIAAAVMRVRDHAMEQLRCERDEWETTAHRRTEQQRADQLAALYERWVKAGPPPIGMSVSRWWDTRLAELRAALNPLS